MPLVPSTPIATAGRILLVAPMLAYPVMHFLHTGFVAGLIPPWIPWHFFWVYFTAVTIIAAGLAILFERVARLAAILLGIEILLFCILIHGPFLFHAPNDPWAARPEFGEMPSRWMNAPKDFGLCGALFIYAGSRSKSWLSAHRDPVLNFGRAILSICVAAFAVLHVIYPGFAPGIPPMQASISFPLPGHPVWIFVSVACFLAYAVAIWLPDSDRNAALLLGATILFFDVLTWIPVFLAHPSQLAGNWLKDIGIAGGAWILYGAYTVLDPRVPEPIEEYTTQPDLAA
jgi:uncharacterized membrane protein